MKTTAWLIAGPAGIGRAAAWLQGTAADPTLPTCQVAASIVRDGFHINGDPTHQGRVGWGCKIAGLLLNARLVEGIFDDCNSETVKR